MQTVSKWGNSLGVRIPAHMAKAMTLREGDQVNLVQLGTSSIGVAPVRNLTKTQALEELEQLQWKLPADYEFYRDEANSRHQNARRYCLASALGAACDTLYSEDMHHGLVIDERLKIVNPFA